MTDDAKLVGEVASQVLTGFEGDPWTMMVEQEWIGVAIDPDHGGQGGTVAEAIALAEAAGATAAPAPVLEAVLGALMAAACPGGLSLVRRLASGEDRAVVAARSLAPSSAAVVAVPWARDATLILAVVEEQGRARLAAIPRDRVELQPRVTVAGDPCDLVTMDAELIDEHMLEGGLDRDAVIAATGALTAARLAGAIGSVHSMTVEYAEQRKQFGVPLASFQALAHAIARQAGAVELTRAAVRAAIPAAIDKQTLLPAAARVVAADCSSEVARTGHQVHGAIGVTQEHDLHRFTMRLRAWRDAYGTARVWQSLLGRAVVARPDALWEASLPESAS